MNAERPTGVSNPFAGTGAAHRASTRQARLIIAFLVVLIVVVVTLGAWLIWGRGGDGDSGDAVSSSESNGTAPPLARDAGDQPEIDSVSLLENAGVQSVNPAPVPESVKAWGDYVKNRSWSGMLRVFEGQDATPVTNDDHSRFPASMNHCGVAMYLVTFRSVNENVLLDAELLNAANNIDASLTLSDGWILTTNCVTPQFRFNSSTDISNLGDVAYEVTEYRQSSVAAPANPDSEDGASEVIGGSPSIVEDSRSEDLGPGVGNDGPNDRGSGWSDGAAAELDPDQQRQGESYTEYNCRYWQQVMGNPLEC